MIHGFCQNDIKKRWKEVKPIAESQITYLDDTVNRIQKSAELNNIIWPVTSTDKMDSRVILQGTYEAEVQQLRTYLTQVVQTMDSFWG